VAAVAFFVTSVWSAEKAFAPKVTFNSLSPRARHGQQVRLRTLRWAEGSEDLVPGLLELAADDSEEAEAKLATEVDANFKKLTPQDLSGLQAQLAAADEASRPPLNRVANCIQKAMESRMQDATKEIEELLMSSGNIDDNIRECLARQDSALPIMAVLQMNIGRAEQAGNEKQGKALTYVFNAINRELESKVPLVNRILSRCLSTEDSNARRELLKAYVSAEGEDESKLCAAITGLVAEADAKMAADPEQRQRTLDLIRSVALDAGVVVGNVRGEEAQSAYTEGLQPLFEALCRTS